MANKTYNQYCSVAHALDIVGERWTLLVVRNLLMGPKRFSDLMKGLPGISTNVLTERLKSLEESGLVMTRYLPPPAASTVYQLTDDGKNLSHVLVALAQWGGQTLGKPNDDQAVPMESVEFMVHGLFWRPDFPNVPLICALNVVDTHFTHEFIVDLQPTGVTILEDKAIKPHLIVTLALEALSALSNKRNTIAALQAMGQITFEGSPASIQAFEKWVT